MPVAKLIIQAKSYDFYDKKRINFLSHQFHADHYFFVNPNLLFKIVLKPDSLAK